MNKSQDQQSGADKAAKSLKESYIVVGKTNINTWHVMLGWGALLGLVATVLFIANPSVKFETSNADITSGSAGGASAPPSYVLTFATTATSSLRLGSDTLHKFIKQSFVASTSISVSSVKITMASEGNPTSQITASIREFGTGVDLTLATLNRESVWALSAPFADDENSAGTSVASVYSGKMNGTFSKQIRLTVGKRYILVLTAENLNAKNFYRVAVDTKNPYAGGNAFIWIYPRPNLDLVSSLIFAPPITVLSPNGGGQVWMPARKSPGEMPATRLPEHSQRD